MIFTIKRDVFLKALSIANRALSSKVALPILNSLKLELDEDGLHITGSNNDLTIKTTVPLKNGEEDVIGNVKFGGALVNGRLLTEIVRKSEREIITFDIFDDTIVKISDGKSNFSLNSAKAEEYPDFDLDPNGVEVGIEAKTFSSIIDKVAFAASTKEQRPILTAINFEAEEGTLTATTTDGFRLARVEQKIDTSESFVANIPAKMAVEVARLIDNEEHIRAYFDVKKALFIFGDTTVSVRYAGGEFPNAKAIIPKSFNYFLEVSAQELLSAMDRVSTLSVERDNIVTLKMSESDVEVSSRDAQTGSATEELSVFHYENDNLSVSFNSSYVAQAIKAVGTKDVVLAFLGEMKPFAIKSTKDDSIIQIVTPRRTY